VLLLQARWAFLSWRYDEAIRLSEVLVATDPRGGTELPASRPCLRRIGRMWSMEVG
jgi:hypothetical protein